MKKIAHLPLTALLCAGLLSSLGCNRKSKGLTGMEGSLVVEDSHNAVCMVSLLGVRSAAQKTGKYVSSISLGETVKLTGDTDKDEAGREYQKVELSDGKSGWVAANGIVAGAQPGAFLEEAVLYKRPDLLTAKPQKAPFMGIVAVTQQRGDWFEVTGEGRRPLGWVQKRTLTMVREDLTAAVLATRQLREKNSLDPAQKLEAAIANSPFPASIFIQKLRERAANAQPTQQPQPAPENNGVQWTSEEKQEPSAEH